MEPLFFKNQDEFRRWLEKNHRTETEVVVGYHKVKTGKPSLTWSESVDQAICFGWIDGIRNSIDENAYCIRFTPRKQASNWSKININKAETLIRQGLMTEAGLEAFSRRKEERSGVYSYENRGKILPEEFENEFRKNPAAWKFFGELPPSYRKTAINWILSAKQEKTRWARLNRMIGACQDKKRLW